MPAGWTIGQTNMGWGEGDNEMYGPILDDLYQHLTEEAKTDKDINGEKAFKKVDQVLDILFYRGNTVGEVYGLALGIDGWTDANNVHWYGGLGIDQTLDQDVADIEGTNNITGQTAHGTWLWNYDHVAQTFYQDFRLFDKYNSTGGVADMDGDGETEYYGGSSETTATGGDDYVNLETGSKYARGQNNPRNRHGIEILAVCAGLTNCTYDTGQDSVTYPGWGVLTLDSEDFAFFDQWVIQSLRDSYVKVYDGSTDSGTQTFTSSVRLDQSYSSWMALGVPGNVCDKVSNDPLNAPGECRYEYKKTGHSVNKKIAADSSIHQTGDP